ncbi:ATP-binding SpoIIE family protein phosphatase [Cellulomonas fimi]|uniref:Putative PAS/PAC sensor protein n=1 Tax=Cellulomonas fimi (strain ATCC 484 / DSM 20113 / JCM 1341 / CCUG 24087 / LMG 16345 / NBRC 15513 / NCIMB 8980 / NCTC 7547 / NRS-133) TaxID=590998 RepID=F4H259_CELFA|nr:SpoIIE family protein phosphatase [Cellulomonas fimi]AEE46356.1 putative PAS/PAC sensor protein [Cellulomonas fimi ATCC 484]NNH07156.1 SpoIIE family protein phosphatase [Cellulomonas fimi]VEH32659.1 anti-sigma F factor [Cellulomonas fimi]
MHASSLPPSVEASVRAFEDLPVAVAAVQEDGLVVAANRAARAIGVGDVVGRTAEETLTAPVAQRVVPRVLEALRTRRPMPAEHVLLEVGTSGDRRDVWLRWSLDPWYDADGRYRGVIVLAQDVTALVEERLAAERRLVGAQERYAVARDVVIALQGALLPASVPVLPRVDLAATYLVAGREQAAGGDWFDAAVTPDGKVSCVVGDVVGHGVAASAAMSQLRAVMASRLLDGAGVSEALESMDRYARVASDAFATTVCVALLDPETGELEYATRGHPAPLVVGPGRARRLPPTGGGPLGVEDSSVVHRDHVGDDEALLLFTDGLVEVVGQPLDQRLQRLADAAVQAVDGVVVGRYAGRTLAERLCLHVPWVLDEGFVDDVTVLAASRRPAPPDLAFTVRATATQLATVRERVAAWAALVGLDHEERDAVVLGASEAAANCVEHAYLDREPGEIRVEGRLRRTTLTLAVEDDGTWQPATPDTSGRGRGLAMVASSGARLAVDARETGTRVELELDARRRAPVQPPVTTPATSLSGGPLVTVAADGVIHVAGVLDTEDAARLLDAQVTATSRGGVVPVIVEVAPTAFLGSAAIRAIERCVRGAGRGSGGVRVVVQAGSLSAQTLAVAGTPVVVR